MLRRPCHSEIPLKHTLPHPPILLTPPRLIPNPNRLLKPLLSTHPLPSHPFGRIPRHPIKHRRQPLRNPQLRLHKPVHNLLAHPQLVLGHALDALRQQPHRAVQLRRWHRLQHEAHARGFGARNQVAREEHPLRFLRPDACSPHCRRGTPPDAGGRVPDARVVRHDHKVAAQRDIAAARDSRAVDLCDRRLGAVEQAHEAVGVGAHGLVVRQRVVAIAHVLAADCVAPGGFFRGQREVVAPTEAFARAFEHDAVD